MTNFDLIKYLVNNNPARLAELLDDIYCFGWNNGAWCTSSEDYVSKFEGKFEIDDFNKWLDQDIAETGFYTNKEIEEWSKLGGKNE